MIKLEIKNIKGNYYLYFREILKINSKSITVALYAGRIDKITINEFLSKYHEFSLLRLTKYLDYQVVRYTSEYLDKEKIASLENVRYYHDEFKDLYPDESTRYLESVFVRYVQGTTAIEGNTISPQDTRELLEHDISPAGKKVSEVYEILNFVKLRDYLKTYDGDISEKLIRKMHAILMENLMRTPGDYRQIQVNIEKADYEPPPAILVPDMMTDLIRWYRQSIKKMHPFELAVLLHTRFELIHPFTDGNGRVGRALMNFILERAGYPTIYLGLPHRKDYLDAIQPADDGNFTPIVTTLFSIYSDQHNEVTAHVMKTMKETRTTSRTEYLLKEFTRLKRQFSKRNV
ncbi:Fic family protein [uncultured Methanoregula sp.]|uniref:Fic family protein n=1 Tax=uncultured Methanoregula sp. TaxID=1005933 RepID=UPI002AAA91F9|nr:Fic family protein [uncultured Methanoregula sp.]